MEIAKVRYSQQEIIEKFGTPIISKQVSKMIAALQNPSEKNAKMRGLALTGITSTGREAKTFKLAEKWKFLIDCPVSISNKCCYYMKETPVQNLAKEKGYAVIGGEPGARFDWILYGKQKGYAMTRMEMLNIPDEAMLDNEDLSYNEYDQEDVEALAMQYLDEYEKELILV